MPELKPLPCPVCGTTRITVMSGEDKITHEVYNQVRCKGCGMRAPEVFAEGSKAIAAWNALPRALRWTHEPPVVAGEYYVRQREDTDKQWSKPRIVEITNLSFETNEYWQFAGPIAPPVEG